MSVISKEKTDDLVPDSDDDVAVGGVVYHRLDPTSQGVVIEFNAENESTVLWAVQPVSVEYCVSIKIRKILREAFVGKPNDLKTVAEIRENLNIPDPLTYVMLDFKIPREEE